MPTIVDELILAYINERNTATLLPYNNEVIRNMQRILSNQKTIITQQPPKVRILYEAEYERVSFFATQYLKLRLNKLKDGHYKLNQLSEMETRFNERFIELTRKYDFFHEQEDKRVEYVCFMVVIDGKSIIIEDNRVDMKYGDIFITEYSDIQEMLVNNEIILL